MKRRLTAVLSAVLMIVSAMPCIYAAADGESTAIHIVHTNDIHGYYEATEDGQIGFAALKTIIENEDADLVLDAGDTFHGQSFATVEEGMSIAELMKEAGYDAMTPGNHDWSYGADRIKELEEAGDFAVLASNVVTDDGTAYFENPYFVKEVTADDGTKLTVGVVGVIDDNFYNSTVPENVEGLKFEEETAEASKTAKTLREEENCDIVVAITHQHDCEEFVSGISGIDAVIAGHEHKLIDEKYTDAEGKSVPVFEAGYYFYDIGCLTLTYDTTSKTVVSAEEEIFTTEQTASMTENEEIKTKIASIKERESTVLNQVIGQSDKEYPYSWEDIRTDEQAIGRIVTAAYLDKTGADVAMENAGGIRAGIPQGDIKYSDLISISPYGNTLLTKELTGKQILDIVEYSLEKSRACNEVYTTQKEALEKGEDPYQYSWPSGNGSVIQFGGIKVTYDMSRSEGDRIVSAQIGGKAVEADKKYTVAMNNYISSNTKYYAAVAELPVVKDYGTCEEALKEYIIKGDLTAADDANLTALEAAELYKGDDNLIYAKPNSNGKLFVIVYDDSRLLKEVKITDVTAMQEVSTDIPSGNFVKVFLWDNELKPQAAALELQSE